jgi:hypothetical protein
MKHRKALALTLGIATVGLTGCPMSEFAVEADSYLGLPTGQRPAAGDRPSSQTGGSGGGGSGGNNSSGSGSGAETGTNPSSVTLQAPLQVQALYPTASAFSVAISQAPQGILALAEPTAKTASSLSVNWSGQGGYQQFNAYQTQATPRPPSDQTAKELALRTRFTDLAGQPTFAPPRFQVSALAPRLLAGNPTAVKIDSVIPTAVTSKGGDSSGVYANGAHRQKFAILLDNDDADIFMYSDGATLLENLISEIKDQIYPTNRRLFGDDPTATEAKKLGLGLDNDTTYFVISRRVNDNGRSRVQGFFSMADLLYADPLSPATAVSNQAKVLYLSAQHVRDAKGSTNGFRDVCATIAHELQHLQFTWARVQAVGLAGRIAENNSFADAWIDEGLAMVAMAANGYAPQGAKPGTQMKGHVQNFLDEAPDYSLTTFYSTRPSETHPTPADQWVGNPDAAYGMAYLFSQYLVDQQGEDVIKKILSSTNHLLQSGAAVTPSNINPVGIVADAVKRDGGNLAVLFGNFSAALALDGTLALMASPEATRKLYDISGIDLRKIRASGPKGVTTPSVQPRPFGVAHLKPSSLTPAGSTLKLTGGTGLSTRLILHQ